MKTMNRIIYPTPEGGASPPMPVELALKDAPIPVELNTIS
jgi:hypothetical protein